LKRGPVAQPRRQSRLEEGYAMPVARTPQNPHSSVQQDPPLLRRDKIVRPGDGLSVWWMGDDRITFPAVSEDTAGEHTFWLDYPPSGVGPRRYVHSREEEGFFLIHGELELKAGWGGSASSGRRAGARALGRPPPGAEHHRSVGSA
jgi:hypothetical protein